MLKKESARLYESVQSIGFEKTLEKEPYMKNELLAYLEQYIYICKEETKRQTAKSIYLENRFIETFPCSKIGVISDTHIGRDNMECLKRAYDKFYQLGIYYVLHLGDFVDGYNHLKGQKSNSFLRGFCMAQIEMAIQNYPEGFKTFVLMGNHDTLLRKLGIYLEKEITSSRPDIQFLGYALAYVKLFEKSVLLRHSIPHQKLIVSSNIYNLDFSLYGHSHQYMFDYNTGNIKVPTCSNVFPNGIQTRNDRNGFLVLEQTDDQIYLNRYTFEEQKGKPTHCLKRELR